MPGLILLVDDCTESLEWMALAFEQAGFSVATARTVNRAVNLLDAGVRPAVVVTDLVIPELSGWDFLKHMREDPELRHIPVVVATATDASESRAIADAVMQKPLDAFELVRVVSQLADSASQRT